MAKGDTWETLEKMEGRKGRLTKKIGDNSGGKEENCRRLGQWRRN